MRIPHLFAKIFLFVIFCYSFSSLFSQNINWASSPQKTYIFEINNKEAEKLLKSNANDSLVLRMLHSPIASFEKKWENRPEKGHFIFANIEKNKVYFNYEAIIPFQVFLFKEYGILTIQIIDQDGNIRSDAKVKIRGKWRMFDTGLAFDKESQTYRIDELSEKRYRILTVELDKFKAVFDLQKHLVNPWYSNNDNWGNTPDFYSYMITDKNKYKPNESLRFKSYALSGNKRPLKKELEIWMRTDGYKYKKISALNPYNPGGYAGEIELHDSLELKLDKSYDIQLRDNKGRIVASQCFKYEDYELYDNNLEVKLKSNTHFYPDNNEIEIKATDANGLLLQDIKADVFILRRNVNKSFTDILMIPDTIMHQNIALSNTETTKIDIPAGLFGEVNCSYEVQVKLQTIDHQPHQRNHLVSFYRSHYNLSYDTRNDTIRFEFTELGKSKNVKAELSYNDSKETKTIELPYEEVFNQTIKSYHFNIPEPAYIATVAAKNIRPELELEGEILGNTLTVELINPLKLDLSWYVYQGNILTEKGSGKELQIEHKEINLEFANYVEVFYFLGDEEKVLRRVFVPKTEYLSVELDMPNRIYPGQTVDAGITVKDNWDNPVKNVDLTAFATNSLLNYHVPDLPYYGASPRTREQRSSYSLYDKKYSFSMPLNYEFWNKIAGLEQLEYYQFIYPRNKIAAFKINTPDSTTQFAPFVMKNGEAVNIYVIEQNRKPVYFSWTNQPKAYSFLAKDSTSQIVLRLHDRALIIDPIQFEKGKKTIFSLDIDHLPEYVRTIKLDHKDRYNRHIFTKEEQIVYTSYTSNLPVAHNQYTWLKQDSIVYPVHHACFYPYVQNVTIGPFAGGKTQYMDDIVYKHEGGYAYQFEDNVVYKTPARLLPEYLLFSSSNVFDNLNDFTLTPNLFKQAIDNCKKDAWFPQNIQIIQNKLNMIFRLPVEKEASGVSNLLFRNRETEKILYPDQLEYGKYHYSEIPEGSYDVILLYNNGKFLEYKDIPFRKNNYLELDMSKLPLHEADSVSKKQLKLNTRSSYTPAYQTRNKPENVDINLYYSKPTYRRSGNTVVGDIFDESGEAVIGANVMLEGSRKGTISDLDGHFEIDIDSPNASLIFSYVGLKTKKVDVTYGSVINVTLEAEHLALDEVVVIAYGTQRKSSLTGSIAGIISSDNGSYSSPPEELDDELSDSELQEAEERMYAELMMLNGLRSNFSDVGFWEPSLLTDNKGKAEFTITFPDNITKWNATVYAMNKRLKTGTARKSINSYKPLMAELKMPQFLVEGDSSYFAGNIRNYTKDAEINGNILFSLNENDTVFDKTIGFTSSHQDFILVEALESDSLTATYLFTRDDGYKDGEKRTIAIEPQGVEIADGDLRFLRNGEKTTVKPDEDEEIHVSITANQIDIYMQASSYLRGYRYACNEQLASKLIGLLNYKIYQEFLGEKFRHDKKVNEIIKRLLDNRYEDKLWSWWGNSSNSSFWMSAHILRALKTAKDAGYTVNLDLRKIENDYADLRNYRSTSQYDIDILHALSEWNTEQNYQSAVEYLLQNIHRKEFLQDSVAKEKIKENPKYVYRPHSYLKEKLLLWEIAQKQSLEIYTADSISKYLKKDVLGSTYCDDGVERSWYSNNLQTTLIAYRIVKNDSVLKHLKEPMQMYVLRSKQFGWNTYQASSALAVVLPDLIAESASKNSPANIMISGKETKNLTEFPYNTILKAGEQLEIEKIKGVPVICSVYKMKRVKKENIGEAFEISTKFESGDMLTAGKNAKLIVEVIVKEKNAEHIMIEVPIPSGCNYASKPNYFWGRKEVHREYFKEKTVIFCEQLPEGKHVFEISLIPRYSGKYILNPAKVEMMYFPVINANNDLRKISIEKEL